MSEFDKGLREARRHQRGLFVLFFCLFLFVSAVVLSFLILVKGTLIRVDPADAAKLVELKLLSGLGLTIGNTVYTLPGESEIVIKAQGFESKSVHILPEVRGTVVRVSLQEKVSRLVAKTDPQIDGTIWEMDGVFVGQGNALQLDVAPGQYRLAVKHPFFFEQFHELTLKRGLTLELEVALVPVSGSFRIESVPSSASVSFKNQKQGITPFVSDQLGGSYEVVLRKEGYVEARETVQITNTQRIVERSYILNPIPTMISFSLFPSGGDLILNGKAIDPNAQYQVDPTQNNSVSYFVEGYLAKTVPIESSPGEEVVVTIMLEEEWGDVEVKTSPGVGIFINGQKIGEEGMLLTLPAIKHVIDLRKRDHRSITRVITPTSKETILVEVILESELSARLREVGPEYKNFAGLELKRFMPGAYTMGAPRYEPGQRANEFERNIQLEKIFYVSKYEVTNQQYQMFDPSLQSTTEDEPVVGLSWLKAVEFCNWLSDGEELTKFYELSGNGTVKVNNRADGYRLLTEAEWEWVARKAGRDEQTIFVWGDKDEVPKMAGNIADESSKGMTSSYIPNYNDGYAEVAPVGSFPADKAGLYDVLGNVREWVHDFYSLESPGQDEVLVDPLGPSYGDVHVVKGSSWRSGSRTVLRSAYREGVVRGGPDIGFRIGRYLYVPEKE